MITVTLPDASTEDYISYRVSGDSAEYIGPDASDINVDSLRIRSIAPKRGNGQYGNRRSQVSLNTGTDVVDVEGNNTVRDRKLLVESSYPVGTTLEQITEDCAKMASLLQSPSFIEKVFKTGIIEL
jgi:hypothetical protein